MTLLESRARVDSAQEDFDAEGYYYTSNVFYKQAQELQPHVQQAFKRAEELKEKGDLLPARSGYALAYLLDAACMAGGGSEGDVAGASLSALEEINEGLLEVWAKEMPGLKKRLDLVIRDASVAEALRQVGQAAGIEVALLPGSLEDACAVTGRKDLRVTYLDLRGAMAAQALDWLLLPVRMTWWSADGAVVAGNERRGPRQSAWVYDVAQIAVPSSEELADVKDRQKRVEAAEKSVADFLGAVRKALSVNDEQALWFAPGALLLFGGPEVHAEAEGLFADLARPDGVVPADLAGLHRTTSARAERSKDARARMLAAREKARLHGVLESYSWQLLAGAADGSLDLEALSELQIAWKQPEMAELLKGPGALAALRSLWAIAESSEALPGQADLSALAESAGKRSRPAAEEALAQLTKSAEAPAAFIRTLYAALALAEDKGFFEKAEEALRSAARSQTDLQGVGTVAMALLDRLAGREVDAEALARLVREQSDTLVGEDVVVLTALACRRAGGEAWRAFRAEAGDLLGRQPLSGHVVVLVNRLAGAQTPLVVSAK